MEITTSNYTGIRVLTVEATRIDAAVAIQFKDMVRDLLADAPGRVVLDLSKVGFVDSSGLGAIVASMKLAGSDRKLELAGLSRNVEKVFALTRMDRVFAIHDTVDTVLTGLANAG